VTASAGFVGVGGNRFVGVKVKAGSRAWLAVAGRVHGCMNGPANGEQ
jgi:hypothetical protein